MKKTCRIILMMIFITFPSMMWGEATDSLSGNWTLKRCLNYAHKHNISLKQSTISEKKAQELVKQAKAAFLPSLSGSVSQGFTNQPFANKTGQEENRYSGSYQLQSSLTLFDAGKNNQTVKQNKYNARIAALNIDAAKTNIEIAILQTYTQLIYSKESIKSKEEALKTSSANRILGKERYDLGGLSSRELSELESQEENDKFNLVKAKNSYRQLQVTLKQLLEITTDEMLTIETEEIDEEKINEKLPSVSSVYQYALTYRPEILASQLEIKSNETAIKIAKAGKMPTLKLNASIGTNNSSSGNYSFDESIRNAWTNSVSLSLNIPIYSNRSNKTNINNARLSYESSLLNLEQEQKDLYKLIENYHLEALNAQASYNASKSNLVTANKRLEYVNEQFKVGSSYTVELLTAQSNAYSAQEEYLQSKYTAILYNTLFKYYGGGTLNY